MYLDQNVQDPWDPTTPTWEIYASGGQQAIGLKGPEQKQMLLFWLKLPTHAAGSSQEKDSCTRGSQRNDKVHEGKINCESQELQSERDSKQIHVWLNTLEKDTMKKVQEDMRENLNESKSDPHPPKNIHVYGII